MKSLRLNIHAVFLLGLLLYLLVLLFIPFIRVVNERNRIWKGYYMILVPDSAAGEDIRSDLSRAGFSFISEGNTTVPFFDYSGIRQIPLRDVPAVFLSVDPRLSEYAEDLSAYFRTSDGSIKRDIIYVRSEESPLLFALRAGGLLKRGEERGFIVDYNWRGTLITLAVFFAVVIFFVSLTTLPRILPILAALPWIEFFIVGADYGGAGPILLYAAVVTAMEYLHQPFLEYLQEGKFRRIPLVWAALMIGAVTALSLTMTAAVSGRRYALLFTLFTLLASGLLAAGSGALLQISRRRMEHRAFLPITILSSPPRSERIAGRRRIMILAALVLVSYAVPGITESGQGYPVPVPVRLQDAPDFSWESLAALSGREDSGSLPDLADYLTHMACQEGFLYGREALFPRPNESIEVLRFLERDGEIFPRSDRVKQFTDLWYEDIMADASKQGITALLLDQDYPAGVTTCRIKTQASFPGSSREQLLVGLIALSPFSVQSTLTRRPAQHSAGDFK